MPYETYNPDERRKDYEQRASVRLTEQGAFQVPGPVCRRLGLEEDRAYYVRLGWDPAEEVCLCEVFEERGPGMLKLSQQTYRHMRCGRFSGSGFIGRFSIDVLPGAYRTEVEGRSMKVHFGERVRWKRRRSKGQRAVTVREALELRSIKNRIRRQIHAGEQQGTSDGQPSARQAAVG